MSANALHMGPWKMVRGPALTGGFLGLIFVIGLGVWSALAPLRSAVLASGVVAADSHRKTIQHLEGGIISAILVKDGEQVSRGAPLLQIEDTKARTTLATLKSQIWDAVAVKARLSAEQSGAASFPVPAELRSDENDPAVMRIIARQKEIFIARADLMRSKLNLISQQVKQTREEIIGSQSQVATAVQQKSLIEEQLSMSRQLAEKGLERRTTVLQLQSSLAEAEGKRAFAAAHIAGAEQKIIEADISKANLRDQLQKEVADELGEAERRVQELREKFQEAAAISARTIIRAPEDGVVADLRIHTVGGVISPGDALLDLVPAQDQQVIEVQIRPEDVNVVNVGMSAQVRLLPYQQKRTPPLHGEVVFVSPDRLMDKTSNRPYYAAKISLDEKELSDRREIHLRPGMPSEVTMQTGQTTVALYALSPLLDSFRRAAIEQ